MAPGANPSAQKDGERSEAADTKKLSEIIPSWLRIPAKYYETLGTNIRGSLFYHIGKDCLEPEQITFGTALLNLFQLSAVILDDICDDSPTRRSQPTIHEKYGREKSLVWSFGLCFHIHDYIMKESPDEEFAYKMIQLYDRMSSLTLEGQYYDLDWSNTNFKQIAELKTSYYTTCFPVAMLVLMKTGDLKSAYKVMHNESLLEVGYWFQAENDFKGTFLDTNTDIDNRTWTLLIQMLAEKYPEGAFEYPTTQEESIELYKKYDIYDEYVRTRQAWLTRLKAMKPEPSLADQPELSEVVQRAKKFSFEYFNQKYILKGFTFKNPYLTTAGVATHPKAEELLRQVHEWADARFGAERMKDAYGTPGPFGACDWINKAFSYVKDEGAILRFHKMNAMYLLFERMTIRHGAGFVKQLTVMLTNEVEFPQHEVAVIGKKYGDDGLILQPLFWDLCIISREIASIFLKEVDYAKKDLLAWISGIADIRAKSTMVKSLDEYYKLRSITLFGGVFFGFGVESMGRASKAVGAPLIEALCKVYVLQHDLLSYGVQVAEAKAVVAEGGEPKPIINAIEVYKRLNPKKAGGMALQDIVDELQGEQEGVLTYIRTFKGTECNHMTIVQSGLAERLVKIYEKNVVPSKSTGWVPIQ